MDHVDIAGVAVGALDRAGWGAHLAACVEDGGVHHHVSLNAAKWVAMRRDPALCAAVVTATSVAADGVSIVLAARFLGTRLPERVPGADLAADLLDRAATRGWRVALLGARPEIVGAVARTLIARDLPVVLVEPGYFDDEDAVADRVRRAAPDLLLVALGTPRAERFVATWASHMGVPLSMGVGGTFDVWAGHAQRAPGWLQRAGLEWAWRLAGAPRARFRRAVLGSLAFAAAIARGERVAE